MLRISKSISQTHSMNKKTKYYIKKILIYRKKNHNPNFLGVSHKISKYHVNKLTKIENCCQVGRNEKI